MKIIFKILIAVSIFISGNLVTAQTYTALENSKSLFGFTTQTSHENFLANQVLAQQINLKTDNNSVYVSQIGDNNDLISITKSLESDVVIIQNGNENNTVIDLNSTNLTQRVVQNGNNNAVLDFGLYNVDVRSATINQTGNNQNLIMSGSNSLSERIQVNMQGQNQSIIIRNF